MLLLCSMYVCALTGLNSTWCNKQQANMQPDKYKVSYCLLLDR